MKWSDITAAAEAAQIELPKEWLPSAMLKGYAGQGEEMLVVLRKIRKLLTLLSPSERERIAEKLRPQLLADEAGTTTSEFRERILDGALSVNGPLVAPIFQSFQFQHHLAENLGAAVIPLFDVKEQAASTMLLVGLHWSALWSTVGRPVFSLTHGLTGAMLLTEPPVYEPEAFKLPFPALAVIIPPSFIPFWYGKQAQSWVELLRIHSFEMSRGICFHVEATCREGRSLWRRQIPAELLDSTKDRQIMTFDDDPPLVENDDRTLVACLRLLRNLLAWVETRGLPGPEGRPEKKRGASRDVPPTPTNTTWVLGRDVKLRPELRRMAAEVALGEKHSPSGWKLRMKRIVMGHWKQQAFGVGRLERKRIHVESYWRGPEGEAAWSHLYQGEEG